MNGKKKRQKTSIPRSYSLDFMIIIRTGKGGRDESRTAG